MSTKVDTVRDKLRSIAPSQTPIIRSRSRPVLMTTDDFDFMSWHANIPSTSTMILLSSSRLSEKYLSFVPSLPCCSAQGGVSPGLVRVPRCDPVQPAPFPTPNWPGEVRPSLTSGRSQKYFVLLYHCIDMYCMFGQRQDHAWTTLNFVTLVRTRTMVSASNRSTMWNFTSVVASRATVSASVEHLDAGSSGTQLNSALRQE